MLESGIPDMIPENGYKPFNPSTLSGSTTKKNVCLPLQFKVFVLAYTTSLF